MTTGSVLRTLKALAFFALLWAAFELGRGYGALERREGTRAAPQAAPVTPADTAASQTWAPIQPGMVGNTGCGNRCGVERWMVKTLSDADAAKVDLRPVETTIAELARLPRPAMLPNAGRAAPTELQVFRVRGYVAGSKDENDKDLHLILYDLENQRTSLIAEIPDPGCGGACRSGFAERFAAARSTLAEGLRHREAQGVGDEIILEVIGVGFFDRDHGQTGAAPNQFELHPVLALRFVR